VSTDRRAQPATGPGFVLDHVAIGVASIDDASAFVEGTLGAEPHGGGPGAGFRFFQWSFAGGARLELLEPAGPPGGFLHRFLERPGPGVHHVTFKVPSLAAAAERARARGYEIVGYDDTDPEWKECFLHPRQAQGLVVQLAEEGPPAAGDEPRAEPPSRPADAPEPVRLRALRLSARDEKAARRQWEETLGGEARALGPTEIELAWPDSPLRIVVRIRPEADEGPLALEVATDRDWPEAGREALGAHFVRRP